MAAKLNSKAGRGSTTASLPCHPWLAPFLEALGNKTRSGVFLAYIAGLIGPAYRKSIQPIAARDNAIGLDELHHIIGANGLHAGYPSSHVQLRSAIGRPSLASFSLLRQCAKTGVFFK